MVVIRLYGALESCAQRATKVHARSFDEAIRALFANFPKLRSVMAQMRVSILVDGKALTFEDCLRPTRGRRIDIMPIVGGTGPAVFIVVGAAMAWGAASIASAAFLAGMVGVAGAAAMTTFISSMGMSLLLGGISQLLFKPAKPPGPSERPDAMPSYVFNGAVNTVSQGGVVPVGFGRMRVGSQVISTNVQTWDIPLAPVATSVGPPAEPQYAPETWNSNDVLV